MKRTLSDREIACLIKYGTGMRVKTIAAELQLSVKSVSTYLTRAQDKLRIKTRAELRTFCSSVNASPTPQQPSEPQSD
jgi:DNA-binding CsgD family transcriptional regulator